VLGVFGREWNSNAEAAEGEGGAFNETDVSSPGSSNGMDVCMLHGMYVYCRRKYRFS